MSASVVFGDRQSLTLPELYMIILSVVFNRLASRILHILSLSLSHVGHIFALCSS